MLQDNYQAQILNPSYFNNKAIILAIPGLAGVSIENFGNFKMTDFVYTKPSGQTIYDLGRFSEKGRVINRNSIHLSVPLLYIGIPVKKGMFSFYIKENVKTAIRFPLNSIALVNSGNVPPEYRNFQSGDINLGMLGFHEFAFGYASSLKDKLHFGLRGKLLFGTLYLQINDWNYGIDTAAGGDEVRLSSKGDGEASLPSPVILDEFGKFQNFATENTLANYFAIRNPGFAIDAGVTIDIDNRKQFSASFTDLGLIYFSNNTWDFYQDDAYNYRGIDISNSTNSKLYSGGGYIFPLSVMLNTKDSLRNVYKPIANSRKLLRGTFPQVYLHYQYKYSNNLFLGITNHTIFQKSFLMNTFSLNALKQKGNLSFVGNLSLHRLSSFTIGGGLQWNTSLAQLFVLTDNIMAFYHPAAQKSYAITFGMNFLLNNEKVEVENGDANYWRRGNISKHLPFYRKYH